MKRNPEKAAKQNVRNQTLWRLRNPEKVKVISRLQAAKWRKANPDRYAAKQRKTAETREAKIAAIHDLNKVLRALVQTQTLEIERLENALKRSRKTRKAGNARR